MIEVAAIVLLFEIKKIKRPADSIYLPPVDRDPFSEG
jgi:hypothetical protein